MSFERLIGAVKTKVKIKFIITRLKVSNKNWREIKDDNNNYRHEYDFGSNHIHTRDKLYALNWVAAAVAQSYKCNWDGFLLWWEHTITYILDSVQDDSKMYYFVRYRFRRSIRPNSNLSCAKIGLWKNHSQPMLYIRVILLQKLTATDHTECLLCINSQSMPETIQSRTMKAYPIPGDLLGMWNKSNQIIPRVSGQREAHPAHTR